MKKTIIISLMAIAGLFLFSTITNASPFDWVKSLFQKSVFGGTLLYPYQGGTGRNMSSDTGVVTVTSGTFNATTTLTLDNLTINDILTLSGQVDPGPLVIATTSAPSIRWATDTDTGIGTITDDTITLMTGGQHRLFVDTNGNIAFGTTTAAGLFTIGTTSDAILNVTTEGNVGIGTSSPTRPLHIKTGVESSIATNVYDTVLIEADDAPTMRFRDSGSSVNAEAVISGDNGALRLVSGSEPTYSHIVFATKMTNNAEGYGAGTERMRIQYDGNVGIGTSTPTALLDVYAATDTTAFLFEQDSTGGILDIQNATGTVFTIDNAGNLTLDTDTFYVDTANNAVSVGTTTYTSLFAIATSTATSSDILFNITTEGDLAAGILIDNEGRLLYGSDLFYVNTPSQSVSIGTSTSAGVFTVGTTTGDAIFNITTEGYVGIGTTAPGSPLTVAFSNTSTNTTNPPMAGAASIFNNNSTTNNMAWLYFTSLRDSTEYAFSAIGAQFSDHTAGSIDSNLMFGTRNNDVWTEKMRITNTGNVGIGTTSPGAKLHISNGGLQIDATNANPYLTLTDTYGSPYFQIVTDRGNSYETMIVNNYDAATNPGVAVGTIRTDGDAFRVFNGVTLTNGLPTGVGTQLFTVQGGGNVGIGTTTPSAILTIAKQSATSTIAVGDSTSAACLKLMDTDLAGWSYCSFLDGVMTCNQTSCE